MTNGEKIKEIFPNINIYEHGSTYSINNEYNFNASWWNAEYKEPSNSEIPKNSPTETLVSLDVYTQVTKERNIAIQQLYELGYEFGQKIEPVIRDNGVKNELNQVKNELEPTTKNNLGVDKLISDCEKMSFDIDFFNKPLKVVALDAVKNIVKDLPLVTPQEPRWIPISEKLPEPFTFVNATCRSLVDDREDWVIETVYLPIPKEANKHGYSDWGNIPMLNCGGAEVIAWVERIIPKPYREVEE